MSGLSIHRRVGIAVLAAVTLGVSPSMAQTIVRVSLPELRADLARGGTPIVLFTSDDPDCGFCVRANEQVPARIRRLAPDAAIWMVSWSPWRSFPAELSAVSLNGPLAGVPAVVRYLNGREVWRVTGISDSLLTELDARLRAESEAVIAGPGPSARDAASRRPEPPAATPAVSTPASPAAPIASLRLTPATHSVFWGSGLRPEIVALDANGRPTAAPDARWSSSDTAVASVSADGIVTAIRRGTATITVQAGGHSASTALTVVGFRQLGRTSAALPCAIADDRIAVFCWGSSRILPTARAVAATDAPSELRRGDIPADARIAKVVTESQHGCVLTEAGSLHCWGQQKDGAAGLGDLTPRDVPTQVSRGELPAGSRITDVAVGPNGTCAIADERRLFCWGARGALPVRSTFATNDRLLSPVATERGELRDGARLSAVAVSINGGCVIADGAPYCWKRSTRVPGPTRIDRGELPAGVTLEELQSDDFTCGRGSDGHAYCWGAARGHRFGTGSEAFLQQPAPLTVTRGAMSQGITFTRVSLGSGAGASCATGTDGEAYCWGTGTNGSAGDGNATRHLVLAPVRVLQGDRPGSVKYIDINCGEQFCTALGNDGVLYGWGLNLGDTLGRDTQSMRLATAPIRARGPIR